MQPRFWESPARILNDYWWAFLLLIVFAAGAYFSRHLWLSDERESQVIPTVVAATVEFLPSPTTEQESRSTATTLPTQTVSVVVEATNTSLAPTAAESQGEQPTVEETAATAAIKVGDLAPEFVLRDVNGNRVALADYQGQPIFLVFFATWCPHCQAEAPIIETLYEKYKAKGLVVLAVNITFNDDESQVKPFAEKYHWSFIPLLDPAQLAFNKYLPDGVPGNVFIDRNRIIRAFVSGELGQTDMDLHIQEILK